jgi:hypothetical protein
MSLVMRKYALDFFNALKAGVRVSRFRTEKEQVEKVLNLIDRINCAQEHAMGIGDVHFDQMAMPKPFARFVFPASIRIDCVDRLAADLRDRSGYSFLPGKGGGYNEPNFTYEDWNDVVNIMNEICSQFKVINPEMVTVAEIRNHVNLVDVMDVVSVGDRCRSRSKQRFVPIPVISAVKALWREGDWNESTDWAFKDFLVHDLKNLFV